MGKRRKVFTEALMNQRIKEGCGAGEEANYKPWITIHDFPSRGLANRIKDWKNGRLRHFMSALEEKIFFLYSWSDSVVDIREQFPLLPLDETLSIANDMGIKHPIDPRSRYPTVLTTDFFVETERNRSETYFARTAKYRRDLEDTRTLEKLAIERSYWQSRNIDWKIVTESKLPASTYQLAKWAYNYLDPKSLSPLNPTQVRTASEWLTFKVTADELLFKNIVKLSDIHFSYARGTTANVIRHLFATKYWIIDPLTGFSFTRPIRLCNRPSSRATV